MPPHFDDSYYGFTIHEIREMQIVNMVICARQPANTA